MRIGSKQSRWLLFIFFVCIGVGTAVIIQTTQAQNQNQAYLPIVSKPVISCQIPGQSYGSSPIIPPATNIPMERHPDMNLSVRGYEPTTADLELVAHGPSTDLNAPQLDGLFADRRLPTFTNAYQRYRWDWDCKCVTDTYSVWDTTLLGLGVTPGEIIHVPIAGYDIGGGYNAQVLYADPQRITLHYARQDDLSGYVFHIEDVCVAPDLVALFNKLNAEGRSELPTLYNHQPFGVALGNEIKVATRDSGHFLDPRSRNSWWIGH